MSKTEDIVKQILVSRGYKTKKQQTEFLHPDYKTLHDPLLLPDIKPAIARLKSAQTSGEPIVIYGDYDVDGLCASSLLKDALEAFGFEVECYIPDRFTDGYGLNIKALNKLVKNGAKLFITVDTGSTAVDEINELNSRGIDVIVTDHHEPPQILPDAVAVINPKRNDSKYPFSELAGSGVAFKFVQALQNELEGLTDGQEKWLLDLAALGTVCDVVPLTNENRTLVAYGLKVLAQSRRPGLQALAEAAGIDLRRADVYSLGFGFGPRLNAAGRLEHAGTSLALLTSSSLAEARPLALKLDKLNSDRQNQQKLIEQQAELMVEAQADYEVLVLADEKWSQGIVGIVAARIMERHQKPTFVMQITGEQAKGSARSFGDFDLAIALDKTRSLLITGGGHKAAAGYSLKSVDIDNFRNKLDAHYKSLKLQHQKARLTPEPDVKFDDLSAMTIELADGLATLEPFGFGNREPVFRLGNLTITNVRKIGSSKQHLKLVIEDAEKRRIEGVMFNFRQNIKAGDKADVLAKLRRSDFGGWTKPELIVERVVDSQR